MASLPNSLFSRICWALLLAVLSGPLSGATWTATVGKLDTARAGHLATVLTNGKVLITGGTTATNAASLFDPATGKWTATGSLHVARSGHTATLLSSGLVLVAGGSTSAATELYDPATGVWTLTGDLHEARSQATATPLTNGFVLMAGGFGSSQAPLATAEIYNPVTGLWKSTGELPLAQAGHTAILLPGGTVLLAGGQVDAMGTLTTSAELYDPVKGIWSTTGSLNFPREGNTLSLLQSGQVLAVGGVGAAASSAEIYDPVAKTWSLTGNLPGGCAWHTATVLPNGQVLVAGGQAQTSGASMATAELFNPGNGTWTETAPLLAARDHHTATLLPGGQVLVTGGYNSNTPRAPLLDTSEIYEYSVGSFSFASPMNFRRTGHTATLLGDGTVLVAGGYAYSSATGEVIYASAEIYDPISNTWVLTGSMKTARSGSSATLLANGQVLVAGGYNRQDGFLLSAELYDPATRTWKDTGSLAGARAGRAILLPNGQVLAVASGVNDQRRDKSISEIYDPAKGVWLPTGSLTIAPSGYTSTLLPNGRVLLTGYNSYFGFFSDLYDPVTGTWKHGSGIPYGAIGASATVLPSGLVLFSGGYSNRKYSSLYDPATSGVTAVGNTSAYRQNSKSILLQDGRVLIASGDNANSPAELFNPATGEWTTSVKFLQNRSNPTATLLPDGRVLFAGGNGATAGQDWSSVEIFDPGLGFGPRTQPKLDQPYPFNSQLAVNLTGTGFTGFADDAAASAVPVIRLQSISSDQVLTLPLDPVQGFDANFFASLAPGISLPGRVFTTVFVNGTPSVSRIASFNPLPSQTVDFPAIPDQTYGGPPLTLAATASSGLPVTFGLISGPATLSGQVLTFTGTGTVIVQAGQPGNATLGYAWTQRAITVGKRPQVIDFPAILGTHYVGSALSLGATASSGLPVTLSLVSGPATLSGNSIVLNGVGTVTIRASQSGDVNNLEAPPVDESFEVIDDLVQTIKFPALPDRHVGDAPLALRATASSGLAVTYGVTGPAFLSGNAVVPTGGGLVTVTAYQAGSASYKPAPPISRSFKALSTQTIDFPATSLRPGPLNELPLLATASSGLPVTYTVVSGAATISGSTAILSGSGKILIAADQAGNEYYSAAPQVVQEFRINRVPQSIAFNPPASLLFGDFARYAATSSSQLPVEYTVISGPARVSGGTVVFTGLGQVTLAINQRGNPFFLAAPEVRTTFAVVKGTQIITFPVLGDQPLAVGKITLQATASSGLPITYKVTGAATVSGNILTLTKAGVVNLTAYQPGSSTYVAAPSSPQRFQVTP